MGVIDTLLQLAFRWRDRPRPALGINLLPGYGASEHQIRFTTEVTNDGTKIARGVVVRGLLDGDVVYEAAPVDVQRESPPERVPILLGRPEQVDLFKALNDRPAFFGKKFTAEATIDGTVVAAAEWDHEGEPPPMSDEQWLRTRALNERIARLDSPTAGDDLVDV